jgi:formate hydrogenlyase subunit 6/NADH:ubiquinone oxidoreductase subunit I
VTCAAGVRRVALACPVYVIKIEQHPSPIKGKVLDRFDIDLAGCIECVLCVEACPLRAITMAPDFEMVATFDHATDLVFDMYELRIAGTPEIDAGMEHIQGVRRGLKGQAAVMVLIMFAIFMTPGQID